MIFRKIPFPSHVEEDCWLWTKPWGRESSTCSAEERGRTYFNWQSGLGDVYLILFTTGVRWIWNWVFEEKKTCEISLYMYTCKMQEKLCNLETICTTWHMCVVLSRQIPEVQNSTQKLDPLVLMMTSCCSRLNFSTTMSVLPHVFIYVTIKF